KFVVKPPRPEDLLTIIARILSVRERKPTRMPVVYAEADAPDGPQVIGRAGNISGTGLLLLSARTLRANSMLILDFVVPGSNRPVKVQGRVTHVTRDTEGTFGA